MRTSVDVHNFLQDSGVQHEIVLLEGQTRSVAEAAALCGLSPHEIAESHLFEADGKPVLVLSPGGRSVKAERIAELVGAKRCRPMDRHKAVRLTDYPSGAVPPVALKTPMPVIVDSTFKESHCLYANAGEHGAVLKVRLKDLVARLDARVGSIT